MIRLFKWWFDQFTLYGGGKGGSSSPPPAPDYRGAAQEQSAASKEIACGQTCANRPCINTPWGQLQWGASAATDPATGAPVTSWQGNVNLTPAPAGGREGAPRSQQGRGRAAAARL